MDTITYTLIRSDRRTVAIQITDGGVVVRAPRRMDEDAIRHFVHSKSPWIERQLDKRAAAVKQPVLTREELTALTKQAAQVIPDRVSYFSKVLGVSYGRVTIRRQRTRWGSCSGKRNLNFNCLLMLTPPAVLDYVVVHELCHLREMNHSPRFWSLVEHILPDYQICRRWLKENANGLISRLPK